MSSNKREVIHTLVSELTFENTKGSKQAARDFAGTMEKLETRAAKTTDSFNKLNAVIRSTLSGQHFEKAIEKYKELWDAAKGVTGRSIIQDLRKDGKKNARAVELPQRLYERLALITKQQVFYGHKLMGKLDTLNQNFKGAYTLAKKAMTGKLHWKEWKNFVNNLKEFQDKYGRLPDIGKAFSDKHEKKGLFAEKTPDTEFFEGADLRSMKNADNRSVKQRVIDQFRPTHWKKVWRNEVYRSDHIFGFQFLLANSVVSRMDEINKNILKIENPLLQLGTEIAQSMVHHLARLFPGLSVVVATGMQIALDLHAKRERALANSSGAAGFSASYGTTLMEGFAFNRINEDVLKKKAHDSEIIKATQAFIAANKNASGGDYSHSSAFNLLLGTALSEVEKKRKTKAGIDYLKQYGVSEESGLALLQHANIVKYILSSLDSQRADDRSILQLKVNNQKVLNREEKSILKDIRKKSKEVFGSTYHDIPYVDAPGSNLGLLLARHIGDRFIEDSFVKRANESKQWRDAIGDFGETLHKAINNKGYIPLSLPLFVNNYRTGKGALAKSGLNHLLNTGVKAIDDLLPAMWASASYSDIRAETRKAKMQHLSFTRKARKLGQLTPEDEAIMKDASYNGSMGVNPNAIDAESIKHTLNEINQSLKMLGPILAERVIEMNQVANSMNRGVV